MSYLTQLPFAIQSPEIIIAFLIAIYISDDIFFFYLSMYLRILHSFPTRRSSDLGAAAPAPGWRAARAGRAPVHGAAGAREDRKSTRLNSSHLGISYAVFCLKKKNESHRTIFKLAADQRIIQLHAYRPRSSINEKL